MKDQKVLANIKFLRSDQTEAEMTEQRRQTQKGTQRDYYSRRMSFSEG